MSEDMTIAPATLTRRGLLGLGVGAVLIATTPMRGMADEADMHAAIKEALGNRPIEDAGVSLKLPPISENGFSVPLTVSVDSPMTEADHITQIALFSPRNPLPDLVRFKLGPRAGKAEIATRIRLSGTQTLVAIAETNQGRLLRGTAETVVTLAACVVL
jgi:sulfur-oxidizing protein SoxY